MTDLDQDANSSGARPISAATRAPLGPESRAARVGRWLCLAGAAIGAAGLFDGLAGTGLLTAIAPADPPMTMNSALGLLCLGGAGLLREREDAGVVLKSLSIVAALLVLAIGVVTIAEHAFDRDLGIDWIISPGVGTGPHPGRPALPSAIALTSLGAALLLFDVRPAARARPSEWLIVTAALIGLTALLGFVFGAELRHRVARAPLIGTALPTALGILVLSAGLLLERPGAGVMGVATSPGPGGRQLRRFALPAIIVPVLLGLLVAFPLRAIGSDALAFAVAVLASTTTIVGLLVLTISAVSLESDVPGARGEPGVDARPGRGGAGRGVRRRSLRALHGREQRGLPPGRLRS